MAPSGLHKAALEQAALRAGLATPDKVGSVSKQDCRHAPSSEVASEAGSGCNVARMLSPAWRTVVGWIACATVYFVVSVLICDGMLPTEPAAEEKLWSESAGVLPSMYQMSSTAFFTSLVININSLIFEDSASKKQLAAFSCFVKAAACYSDMRIGLGKAPVRLNIYGRAYLPDRFLQWAVTTPTLVLVLSRLSDMPGHQVAIAMAAEFLTIMAGFFCPLLPQPWHGLALLFSFACYAAVMHMMYRMIQSAINASDHDSQASQSMRGIYYVSVFVWSLFPVMFLVQQYTDMPMFYSELTNVAANFVAKVVFSSSVMYSNYISIDQRRAMAQQLLENRARVQMVHDLQEAMAQKDDFLSMMSHELRTPLNGIIQLSDALGRGAGGPLNDKGTLFIRTITNSGNQLLSIISDILDAASLKKGTLVIKHETVCLAQVVDQVLLTLGPLAKSGVGLVKNVAKDTPDVVGDAGRISQILYNLAGNALKFTTSGVVRISVSPCPDDRNFISIRVSDTGIGIPRNKLHSIWGAFQQVDMSTTRKYGGTGLGLSLTKQLVEAHHGDVHVKSKVGKGTVFNVRLPLKQPEVQKRTTAELGPSIDSDALLMHADSLDQPAGGRHSGWSESGTIPGASAPVHL